jgi:hypothetical protein
VQKISCDSISGSEDLGIFRGDMSGWALTDHAFLSHLAAAVGHPAIILSSYGQWLVELCGSKHSHFSFHVWPFVMVH